MTAPIAVEPQEDWIQEALKNAPPRLTLPARNYGRPAPAPKPKQYDPVCQSQTDDEFAEVLKKHWGQAGTNRRVAARRAHDWMIESYLRAGETSRASWGTNLNHTVTLHESEEELFQWLLCVGGHATINKKELLPACASEVKKLYSRTLIESDRWKLTLWLHLELAREAFDRLIGDGSIWWHNGVWHLSVDASGPVIRRRKKRRAPTAKRRAA